MQIIAHSALTFDAAEKKLSDASGLLDVSEHGFDGVFANPVSTSVSALPDPGAHGLDQRTAFLTATGLIDQPPSSDPGEILVQHEGWTRTAARLARGPEHLTAPVALAAPITAVSASPQI